MRIIVAALTGMLTLLAATVSYSADPLHDSARVDVVFTAGEIRAIRAYYESHTDNRGSGKVGNKSKRLPPGIAKNLARGKALPPGIAKQVLPYELRRTLPPVPDGYERIIVAGKILLVEIATQVIHDALSDILLN